MSGPVVRGWCPGALRPMASGDGLVVRIRPRLARLSAPQLLGLAALADRLGDGGLELTSRANLQMYGVAEGAHGDLLEGLSGLGLVDDDPALEGRRNVLVSPLWQPGDLTERLTRALYDTLPALPELPAKVGFAVDASGAPVLGADPADFRLELGQAGLILRAEGVARGRPVTEGEAIPALIDLARLFAQTRRPEQKRVRDWAPEALPAAWQVAEPLPAAPRPRPGAQGAFAAPFGRIAVGNLVSLMGASEAQAVRVTPWRMLLVEGNCPATHPGFVSDPTDPILTTAACRGAPFCPQGSVETRDLARRLAPFAPDLHMSGCAKGCARSTPAALTVVGRDGTYDLVEQGCASDTPALSGLTLPDLIALLESRT
ncbi:cobalamin biosynthesis protein CobG [Sagittula salina]|uniref:Cobalamin biosynthesis protein CobG n=1 Tax=Sagittula salina TaxID=2820268 RepID=A0A940MS87_9RHOB|nr:cobalamin biosynthesis protein CobG [Sagittula salina]MBP0484890.1 cobalamin biosynthesis protein CobG [Sagittula salina]